MMTYAHFMLSVMATFKEHYFAHGQPGGGGVNFFDDFAI